MEKNDIPKIHIPDSMTKNGFRMIPKSIINQINNKFIEIKKQIDIDKKIEIEMNRDISYFNYYYTMYNIIQKEIYKLFNIQQFWKCNMDYRVCEHKYKEGFYAGLYCGKRVDINCPDKNGMWKCCKHVSTKYYKPKDKNVNPSELCIAKTGYKNKFNCNMLKKYGEYCIHHYKIINNFVNIKDAKKYYDEINLLSNIYIEKYNNCKVRNKTYICNINNKNIDIIDKYEKKRL